MAGRFLLKIPQRLRAAPFVKGGETDLYAELLAAPKVRYNPQMDNPAPNFMLDQAATLLQNAIQYEQKDYRSVYQAIIHFESECKEKAYGPSAIDDACFFLCAFLDEQYPWEKSLVSTFYKSDMNKDNEFFDRLERRQTDPHKNIDLLELAYCCLSLGFHSKSSQSPLGEKLLTITDSLYSNIRNVRDDIPCRLAIGTFEKEERHWRCPPIWVTTLIGIVILMAIFIPYNKKLNQYITPVLNSIKNTVQTDSAPNEN